MSVHSQTCHIGLFIFPAMTQLDFAGPYEVFARLPDTAVDIVARTWIRCEPSAG